MNVTFETARERLADHRRPLLLFVEGNHDVEFLKRASKRLHADDPSIADLEVEEARGSLIFVPAGGGNLSANAFRFDALNCSEFHIIDREAPPLTNEHLDLALRINQRPNGFAVVTKGRSLENYIPSQAIECDLGLRLDYGWDDDVAEVLARAQFAIRDPAMPWELLRRSIQRRFRDRAKRQLNRQIVDQVTLNGLWMHDPGEDIANWLRHITATIREPSPALACSCNRIA